MFKRLGRLLAWIDRAVERADQRRIERYLGQSVDMVEFEARTRELGYGSLEFATGRTRRLRSIQEPVRNAELPPAGSPVRSVS